MYLPRHFQEERLDELFTLVREHPLATLVSPGEDGLFATHLPMLWDPEPAPYGTLTGHVARPNPHGRTVRADVESLAIFMGAEGYVSPSWLPSKREHGKVVPTWNYVAVHAYGEVRWIDDVEWLRALVERLTDRHEAPFAEPWKVTDAPESFFQQMLKGIIGVEMPVRRVEGKWKLSQNRPAADVEGVIAGLEARGDAGSKALASVMGARRRDGGA